jgi:predicted ATPase
MDEPAVLPQLQALFDAQLVNELSVNEFAFRPALTREAVYAARVKRQPVAYHTLVAEVLEQLYGESAQLAGHVAALAYHFRQAADWPKALEYAQRAGEQAQDPYAPHEAVEQFTLAIEAAGQLAQAPDMRLPRRRGQAYEILGDFDRARADYELRLRLAREAGAAQAEWQTLLGLGF